MWFTELRFETNLFNVLRAIVEVLPKCLRSEIPVQELESTFGKKILDYHHTWRYSLIQLCLSSSPLYHSPNTFADIYLFSHSLLNGKS